MGADDGETLGRLLRPSIGFGVAAGYQRAAKDSGPPSSPGQFWLVPAGKPEAVAWPREHPGFLPKFAKLHADPPVTNEKVASFASRYGWLRHGTLIVPDPLDWSEPVLGDWIEEWRQESRRVAELLSVMTAAQALRQAESALERKVVVSHFRSQPDGTGATLWVPAGGELRGLTVPGQPISWYVVPGKGSPGEGGAIAFAYADIGPLFIPMRFEEGPPWGSDLESVPRAELAALAAFAVGVATQAVLQVESHAVLTLAKGIRTAPSSLLGAVYLSLARKLFERGERKVCPECGEAFPQVRSDQIFCGEAHKARAYRRNRKKLVSATTRREG